MPGPRRYGSLGLREPRREWMIRPSGNEPDDEAAAIALQVDNNFLLSVTEEINQFSVFLIREHQG